MVDTRQLGTHDVRVSVIGMGGIVAAHRPQEDVARHVAAAIDAGVTYFDTAPSYGNCQELLGPAIEPFRDAITLACKTQKHTAEEARLELEESLRLLRTDHVDIYQCHAIPSLDALDRILGPGGALETFRKARDEGKARLLGFTTHSDDVAVRAIDSGCFDTVLFPLNYRAYTTNGLGKATLDAARGRGMGILAIKSMARTPAPEGEEKPYAKCWYMPEDRPAVAWLQVRFTLGLPGVCAIVPPGDPGLFDIALATPNPTTPLSPAEAQDLQDATCHYDPIFG
ncbi:aldo/keto reductase [Planctomycetota bacterium]